MKKTAIILEDELNTLELHQRLAERSSLIDLLGAYDNMKDAEKNILRYRPDLLFLDIKVNGRYVFEMLENLKQSNLNFSIIFISGHVEEQLQNIVNSLGYFKQFPFGFIQKPLDLEKLENKLDEYIASVPVKKHTKHRNSILVKKPNNNIFTKYKLDKILYFEAVEGLTFFYYLKDNEVNRKMINKTLNELELKLSNSSFYRLSSKHLVNADYIFQAQKMEKGNSYHCYLEADGYDLKKVSPLVIPEKKVAAFKIKFSL